jgi:hypothetical protein
VAGDVPKLTTTSSAPRGYGLNRFTFLLGADDGQALFDPEP